MYVDDDSLTKIRELVASVDGLASKLLVSNPTLLASCVNYVLSVKYADNAEDFCLEGYDLYDDLVEEIRKINVNS